MTLRHVLLTEHAMLKDIQILNLGVLLLFALHCKLRKIKTVFNIVALSVKAQEHREAPGDKLLI